MVRRTTPTTVASFLAALPAGATSFVFRRVGTGWGVGLPGGPAFWTDAEYPWRGKDLHAELARVLRDHLPDVASLDLQLESEEDWAWYADD